MKNLKDVQKKIHEVDGEFMKKQEDVANLKAETLKTKAVDKLEKIARDYKVEKEAVQEILAKASTCRETVDYIKNEMDECDIPHTITLRADEVEKFAEKLERISQDFQELKKNDSEDSSSDTKATIRKLTDEIVRKLSGFEDEKADFIEFQKTTLEQYLPKDFSDIKNAPIILQVREHKLKIQDANRRLNELEDFLKQGKAQKSSLLKIDASNKSLVANLNSLSKMINEVPKEIDEL